jgi:hypothetical protein
MLLPQRLMMGSKGVAFVGYHGTSGGGSSGLAVSLPAGVQQNDLLIGMVAAYDNSGGGGLTWTGDTGWNEVLDENAVPNLRVAWKIAGASEPTPTFTNTGSPVTTYNTGAVWAFRNAAYDTIGTIATSVANGTVSYNSVTLAGGTAIAVIASGKDTNTPTYGTPSGFTAQSQLQQTWSYLQSYYKEGVAGSLSGLSSTVSGQISALNAGVIIGVKLA